MNRVIKRIFFIAIIASCLIMSGIPYVGQIDEVRAATEKEKNVKRIANLLEDAIYYQIEYQMGPNQEYKFDFSTKSDCKKMMISSKETSAEKYAKNIFGKKITGAEMLVGDWGCEWPIIKVYKIKTSGKKLLAYYKMYRSEDEIYPHKQLVASGKMNLKKSKVSKYKYAVTKLTIKRNDYRFMKER